MRRRKSRRRLCGCWSGEAGTFRTQTTDPLFNYPLLKQLLSVADGRFSYPENGIKIHKR